MSSRVAPANVPVNVIDDPVTTVRLAKLSFGGGDWPNAATIESAAIPAKTPGFRAFISRIGARNPRPNGAIAMPEAGFATADSG
jgi:hypothetical protein